MFKSILMSSTALAIALTASVAQGSYFTSFEDPPFTVGQSPDGVDGWGDSGSGVVVTTSQASDGTQSVLTPVTTDNSGATRIFNTTEAVPGVDTVLSFDFFPVASSHPGLNEVFIYVFAGATTGNSGYLRFTLISDDGDPGNEPVLSYRPDNAASATSETLTANAWTNGQWNTMRLALDVADQTLDMSINGLTVAQNLPISAGITSADRISGTWLFSDDDDVYWDRVSLGPVPEPATLALLGLGGLAMLSRRRRHV